MTDFMSGHHLYDEHEAALYLRQNGFPTVSVYMLRNARNIKDGATPSEMPPFIRVCGLNKNGKTAIRYMRRALNKWIADRTSIYGNTVLKAQTNGTFVHEQLPRKKACSHTK